MDTKTIEVNQIHNVEIYSTPTCHFCHMAKDWLGSKNIAFTDYNVAENLDKRKEMVEMTGQMGVPVIKIGEDVMVGFNQEMMAKLLQIAE
jgi:glutaredoxin-like YruB-family protein